MLKNEGDERPGFIPGDLIFIVKQQEHPVFTRRYETCLLKKTTLLFKTALNYFLEIMICSWLRIYLY